ncbi:unnamed protein product, partial [Brenthis ino]
MVRVLFVGEILYILIKILATHTRFARVARASQDDFRLVEIVPILADFVVNGQGDDVNVDGRGNDVDVDGRSDVGKACFNSFLRHNLAALGEFIFDQFPPAPASESDRKRHNHMIGAAHCAHLSPRVRPTVTSRDRARPPPGPPDTANRLHWIDPPTFLIQDKYYINRGWRRWHAGAPAGGPVPLRPRCPPHIAFAGARPGGDSHAAL